MEVGGRKMEDRKRKTEDGDWEYKVTCHHI